MSEENAGGMQLPTITFGADPEFFALNRQGGLIPSWLLNIGGDKANAVPIPGVEGDLGKMVSYLKDGVAIELNVEPQNSLGSTARVISSAVGMMKDNAPEFVAKKVAIDFTRDVIKVPKKYQDHELFQSIGCTLDMDAFTKDGEEIRKRILPEQMGENRFTGGHIHIGCDPWPEWLPKKAFIQFLSVLYNNNVPAQNRGSERDQFYGMPGIYRETKYGIEYRSPNTWWLTRPGHLQNLTDQIRRVLSIKRDDKISGLAKLYNEGDLPEFRLAFDKKNYQKCDGLSMTLASEMRLVMDGKKKVVKPARLALSGYRRESEDGRMARDINPEGGLRVQLNVNDPNEVPPIFGVLGRVARVGDVLPRAFFADIGAWIDDNVPQVQRQSFANIEYSGIVGRAGESLYYFRGSAPRRFEDAGMHQPIQYGFMLDREGTLVEVQDRLTGRQVWLLDGEAAARRNRARDLGEDIVDDELIIDDDPEPEPEPEAPEEPRILHDGIQIGANAPEPAVPNGINFAQAWGMEPIEAPEPRPFGDLEARVRVINEAAQEQRRRDDRAFLDAMAAFQNGRNRNNG